MKRILVIRFSAMGDVAMTLPVLKLILKENPDLEITLLTEKKLSCLFENNDRLIPFGADLKKSYKGILGLKRLHSELSRKYKFDAIIDLHNVLRSNILDTFFRISGTPVYKIDKQRSVKRKMIQTKKLYPLPHTTDRYFDVFKQAGLKIKSKEFNFPSIFISDKDYKITESFINSFPGPYIAFAPFAKHPTKSFPVNKSEELIRALSENYTVFLLGGTENSIQFNVWEKSIPNTHSTIHLNLVQQIALMSHVKVVISMDSANMHLAAIQGIPVISIWGATHPYFGFSGIGTTSSQWIYAETPLSCRPCSVFGNKPCINKQQPYACMNQIKITSIIEAVNQST